MKHAATASPIFLVVVVARGIGRLAGLARIDVFGQPGGGLVLPSPATHRQGAA